MFLDASVSLKDTDWLIENIKRDMTTKAMLLDASVSLKRH